MKTRLVFFFALIFAICSCTPKQEKPAPVAINFTINKIVPLKNVDKPIRDSLKKTGILLGTIDQPEIGYLPVEDSLKFKIGAINDAMALTYTSCPVDDSNSLMFVFAVNPITIVDNSFIKKAVANDKEIVITFNDEGAKRWADYTKNNTDSDVAFILDGKICFWTHVEGEISNGMAKITGLKSAEDAQILAYKLMKNLPL
jgi:hypothetical protein